MNACDTRYVLLDPGLGTPTTWGRWDPEDTNEARFYSDGRGLNSVQILAFLRVAASLTGNATFDAAADTLKEDHGCVQDHKRVSCVVLVLL